MSDERSAEDGEGIDETVPQYTAGSHVPEQFRNASTGKQGLPHASVSYPRALRMPNQRGFTVDSIGSAWATVLRNPWSWILNGGTFLLAFCGYLYAQFWMGIRFGSTGPKSPAFTLAQTLGFKLLFNSLLWTIFLLYFSLSAPRALGKVDFLRSGQTNNGAATRAVADVGIFSLVGGLALALSQTVLVAAPVLILPFLSFVPFLMVDRRASLGQALRFSTDMASPHYGGALLVWLLLWVQLLLSFGLLALGMALGAPVIVVTMAVIYRAFVPLDTPTATSAP